MKLFTQDGFLTKGSAPLPSGKFRAAAIHPSSEVDLAEINGAVLTVGGIVPLSGNTSAVARAIRYTCGVGFGVGTGQHAPADGQTVVGEKLVLALYEDCDALVPLGARAPVFRKWAITDEDLPAAEADQQLVFRVPMQGRTRCALAFVRDNSDDFSVSIIGRRVGTRAEYAGSNWTAFPMAAVAATETWFVGGAPPPIFGADYAGRQLNIENERFDELLVYTWGSTVIGGASLYFAAEAFGEGANL